MADRITVNGDEYELCEYARNDMTCGEACDLLDECESRPASELEEMGVMGCMTEEGCAWKKRQPSAMTVDTACQQGVTCASTEWTEPMPKADTITETDMIAAAALIRQCRAKADDYRTAVIKRNLIAVWNGYATVIERLLAIAGGKALTCDGCQRLAHRSVLPACQTCRRMPRQDMFSTCEK